MNVQIRLMEEQDLDLVLRIAAEAAEAPRWRRGDYEKALLSGELSPLIMRAWVAQTPVDLAGFAVARWVQGDAAAELESVVVEPRYRGQGVGTALIRACMEWATSAGASALQLEVRASNDTALAFYSGLGFVSRGLRRAYYSLPTEDALVLEARCAP